MRGRGFAAFAGLSSLISVPRRVAGFFALDGISWLAVAGGIGVLAVLLPHVS